MTLNESTKSPFDANSTAPVFQVFPLKNKDGNIPSRCGSAPPYFEESCSSIRNPTVKKFYSDMLEITDDEKLLMDPAYIAYYNAHVNLNPRLPPPLISREKRNLVGLTYPRKLNSSDENKDLNSKMSLLSTHQEETEDDILKEQSQFKDEIVDGDNPACLAGPSKSFAELLQGLNDHTRVSDTTNPPSTSSPLVKNDNNNSTAEHVERKDDNMLLCEAYGLPFYPPNSTIQQIQRFQHQTHYTPQAMNQSYNVVPTFSANIKPAMLNQGLAPPHYMNVGNQYGPRLQMMNTFGLGAYTLPPGSYPPYFGGNLPHNMLSLPFDSYARLLNRGTTVQPQFPSPLQGHYFQHSFMENNGRNAAQSSQYEIWLAQKDPNLAAFMYHGHRNLASSGFNPMLQFPMNEGNHMVLGDHTNISQSSIERADLYSGQRGQRAAYNVEDPNRHTYLEDLKYGGGAKLELSDIAGKIVEFSTDQHGSRFLQQKLETSTVQEKEHVFTELLPHASKLMIDVFGNYVIQKLFEYGTSDHRKQLADQFTGQMLTLSLQMYGCRVIQKALEVIEVDQRATLAKELDGHVIKCVHDQNGNHVIQKCIEHIPIEEIGFIIAAFHGEVATLSVHPYGCRVIQRALEHCSDTRASQFIIEEVLDSASMLAHDQYGNYVIQHILESGKPHERSQVISKLAGKFVEMSQHKYASNVIEKCLIYGDASEKKSLIREIVGRPQEDTNLLVMVKDQYANYVIQRILEICNDEEKNTLMNCLRENLDSLKKYTYGKHLVARYEQLLSGSEEQKPG